MRLECRKVILNDFVQVSIFWLVSLIFNVDVSKLRSQISNSLVACPEWLSGPGGGFGLSKQLVLFQFFFFLRFYVQTRPRQAID